MRNTSADCTESDCFDVIICGGGLAGLTLARQLSRQLPSIRCAVVEKTERPLPEACHKVGESSVEVGTHYLASVLGLGDYLDRAHLPKNGLRFFCGGGRGPLAERIELGPAEFPPVPSYQMDRGRLENDLRAMVEPDVALFEGYRVEAVELSDSAEADHRVGISRDGDRRVLRARWVVDATGRRRWLGRQLGLGRRSEVRSSAAWFRVGRKVDIGSLVDRGQGGWHARDPAGKRWLSTVHLTGAGYWVWLIPLRTGHTSVGIVASASHHPPATFSTRASTAAWLSAHEPVLAAHLGDAPYEDWRLMKDYSYGAARFLSAERWACVGEAAMFVDPLYSPGTDFIAYTNTMTTEAIADDLAGRLDPARIDAFNQVVLGLARDLEQTLGGHGDVLGHGDVFAAKLWWDYYDYWAFMAPYYFHRIYALPADAQPPFLAMREAYEKLNRYVQATVKAWAALRQHDTVGSRGFIPLPMGLSALTELHVELQRAKSPAACLAQMERNLAEAEQMVAEVFFRALHGVGADRAAELGARVDLPNWDVRWDHDRLAAEALPRPKRRDALHRIARDLDRALGRCPKAEPPLAERFVSAMGCQERLAAPVRPRSPNALFE